MRKYIEKFKFINGEYIVHGSDMCKGSICTIHNPSNHNMINWPMNLRETNLIERMCKHHVGHADPDSAEWMERILKHKKGTWSSHGCDGCCSDNKNGLIINEAV